MTRQPLDRALVLRARGEYRAALAALSGAADDVESLLELSRLQEELGDFVAAERTALRAVELAAGSPQAPVALARQAATARALRRPREAEATAREAAALARTASDEPALAETLLELGMA